MSKTFDPEKAAALDSQERLNRLRPMELLKALGVTDGWICVDLGSGTGVFTLPLSELVGKAGIVYAVDFSPDMMQRLLDKRPPANVRSVIAPVTDTNLEGSIANLCLLAFITHEVEQPELLLAEARRLLLPAGKIALLDWQKREGAYGPPLSHRISLEDAQQLLAAAGFVDLELTRDTDDYYLRTGTRGP